MQALLEFAPLVAFFVAYRVSGLYAATAVLMVAMAVLLIVDYARLRRVPAMHALSAALVFLFGTATLVLHDLRFIQWKPTVFFWLASAAFLLVVVAALLESRKRPVVSGREELIGASGEVIEASDQEGWARVHSETWRVRSRSPLKVGQRVRVAAMQGLTLDVVPETDQGASA